MSARQPIWKNVYASDYSRLDIDETGVYAPELTISESLNDVDDSLRFLVFRFSLDKCTFINGVLSDNPYHPETAAWFADSIEAIAQSSGEESEQLRAALLSDDPIQRARAYESIGAYHGFENFDTDPIIESEAELTERLSK